ncbi:hypothetical protein IFM89_000725 [Coptis chinensis]|uniref:Uncharacterized protein n=1 Tax=Coptis chinensis TaxID=261450 RepID=A0A835ISC0_9MAGN|nr:hypothetical protein IFM89_000725 [Coptis chinensis]
MQKRNPVSGRPTGTDGSDYSYRMVVEPRYMNVAKGKARFRTVFIMQGVIQIVGVLGAFFFPTKDGFFNTLQIAAFILGLMFIVIGKTAVGRSHVTLLSIYCVLSSLATVFCLACTTMNTFHTHIPEEMQQKAEIFAYMHIVIGAMVEMYQINTSMNLMHNMAPPKRE